MTCSNSWQAPGCRGKTGEAEVGPALVAASPHTSQLLTAGLLPEQTLPCWEKCALEQSVLQDTFNTTQGLDHISPEAAAEAAAHRGMW